MAVVTLQAGNFANYCGAHFWNFEDEVYGLYLDDSPIDPEKCYHESPSGRWVPRLVCVDKTGAIGRLGGDQAVEEPPIEDSLQPIEVFRQELVTAHPFQEAVSTQQPIEPCAELRTNMRYWSDFLKVNVAGNVHEMVGVHHGLPFTYFVGRSETHSDEREEIENRVRREVEKSSRLEALHALVDSTDGFASIAEDILHWTRDEQPKCGILVAPLSQHQEDCIQPNSNVCTLNDALNRKVAQGFFLNASCNAQSNMIIPIDVPLWSTDPWPHWTPPPSASSYSSSAVIGIALHNISFPYRARARTSDASTFMRGFRTTNPMCGMRISLPCLRPFEDAQYMDLTSTPFCAASCPQFWTIRGAAATDCDAVANDAALRHHGAGRWTMLDERVVPVPIPFPQEFDASIQHDGRLGSSQRAGDVESCSIGTVLYQATEPSQSVVDIISSMNVFRRKGRVQAAGSYGLDDAEFTEVVENLRSLYH